MYESLINHSSEFHVFILALDPTTQKVLTALDLPAATILNLSDFEDERLLSIKNSRTKTEYYWTCTPSLVSYVLKRFELSSCTYLDADLFFYSSPEILLHEMTDRAVLITKHRYSPSYYDFLRTSGKYCVQFMTFKNDANGLKALQWWRDACLDWCYARYEDGKFGDQKYLDDWPERFEGVHVLQHLGGGVAPWNVQRYKIVLCMNKLYVVDGENGIENELIFYHFHNVRFYASGIVDLTTFKITKDIENIIYRPYIKHLERTKDAIRKVDELLDPHGLIKADFTMKSQLAIIKRMFRGRYNVIDIRKL